jgi:chromosome condensin MukBEF MukE localization factor
MCLSLSARIIDFQTKTKYFYPRFNVSLVEDSLAHQGF